MMRVIKLGGSLLAANTLRNCLDAVARYNGQTLLVPGGGMFADQVRVAQAAYHFDDVAAHRMALLAMQQMALVFNSYKPEYQLVDSLTKLPDSCRVGIWQPQVAELDAAGIPASWDISSDSLAAWLARSLGADELILVKAAEIDPQASLNELQDQDIVDKAFVQFANQLSCSVIVLNQSTFVT